MGPTYSGILGPLAFVLILARGVLDGSSPDQTLITAVVSLLVFALVGYVCGRVADHVLWESVKRQFEDEMHARETRHKPAEAHRTA
jgi:hypothetical protein